MGKDGTDAVTFGGQRLSIEEIVRVANHAAPVEIGQSREFVERMEKAAAFLEQLLAEEGTVYGVTTGYGDSCTVAVPKSLINQLPLHLSRFHGCGMGAYLTANAARAVMAARLASLTHGYSGVRLVLVEHLARLLNENVGPLIPEEGSVGASGDLTPLSYVVALLVGERNAIFRGSVVSAGEAYKALDMQPLELKPKEALAIMNGTAMMTGLACLAFSRAGYLARLCAKLTSMAVLAVRGNRYHFDEFLFSTKPHPGQAEVARWIREDLQCEDAPRNSDRLQDRYSLRCAPHIIGVLMDSLPWLRDFIENELNSTNDNPIIDGEGQHILHGGHFYGGHIAFAMDALKTCIANLADLMDRQMALLVDPKFNNGLPANLSASSADRASINHGLKALQIGASAWTAEALKLTMPASVFSRSTECHNQDKVSMGTISARDCLRILDLTEQVAAAHIVACTHALELRIRSEDEPRNGVNENIAGFKDDILASTPLVVEDRPLESELRQLVGMIQEQRWSLYEQ